MTGRDNQVKTYLTDAEYLQIKDWADKTDKSMSELVRQAILEYTDRDRVERLESDMTELHEKIDRVLTLVENDAHTHKDEPPMNQSGTALETARDIIRRLQENHEKIIKNADVERAIEDMAGIDDRTIRKYKDIFRKRGLLFEHPGESAVWTTDTDEWLEWMNNFAQLNGYDATEEVAERYPAAVTWGTDGKVRIEVKQQTE